MKLNTLAKKGTIALLAASLLLGTPIPGMNAKEAGSISVTAEAKTKTKTMKPSLSAKSMEIPVGKITGKTQWDYRKAEYAPCGIGKKLTVKNKVKGASYRFASSNSKVVKIAKNGGYLTGVKAGKATITCTQMLKGRKTVVGKCKVTVKNASFYNVEFDGKLCLGKSIFNPATTGFILRYRNPDAKYTFDTGSNDLKIYEKKWTDKDNEKDPEHMAFSVEGMYTYLQIMEAKKSGTYQVSVKEIYQNKTRKIGSFTVTVYDPEVITETLEKREGDDLNFTEFLLHPAENNYTNYKAEIVEGAELVKKQEYEDGYFYGTLLKEGTMKIKVSEKATGKEIGTAVIQIKRVACESIEIRESHIYTFVGNEDSYLDSVIRLNPEETTEPVNAVSKDENIFRISTNEQEEISGTPVAAGETKVVFTCGNQSVEIPVTVFASEDEMYDAEESGDEDYEDYSD